MRLWTSIKKNKNILLFLSIIFVIGIILGVIVFYKQSDITKQAISLELNEFSNIIKSTKQNQILFHSILLLILFLLSFTVVGVFGNFFYLFYEGCSLGFSICIFALKFKTSGAIFGIFFFLITKLLYILLVGYVCILGIKIAKKIVGSVVLKKDEITYRFLKRYAILLVIVVGSSLLNEIIIHFFGNKLLSTLLFLLK